MNPVALRRSAWSSAAAAALVLLALAIGGCEKKEQTPPKQVPAERAAADASSAIGRIHAMEGDVRLVGPRGEERAQAGVLINSTETVRAMPNAWALIAMLDGATITLRADTEMRFDDYRYDPDGQPQQNTASISLVKGALRSITGLVGHSNPAGYQIKTPTATIGIRGTDHEPAYYPPPPPGRKAEHPPGTYDKVNTGETVIRRPTGEVAVRRGQTAYAPVEVKARPQILAAAPVFYQRHAEMDRRVVDRREEFTRQFAETQQRRQQERQRQIEEQKKREAEKKQRVDDQKKKLDERAKQQEALKQKQDEHKREREKKQADLKKKQDEAKKKREEAKKDRKKTDEPDKAKAKDMRQQQREQQQKQQQKQQQQQREQQRQQQQQQRQQQQQQRLQQQQQREQLQQRQQQMQQQRQQQQRQPERGGR